MGFRKLFVKIMNLVYIAGAGVAIYGICTRPIVSVDFGVELTSKEVGKFVTKAFGVEEKSSKAYTVRLISRAEEGEGEEGGESEEKMDTFKDWLTVEKVAKAFPKGIKLHQPIEIPLSKAFEFKNNKILKETVVDSLDSFVTAAVNAATPGVYQLFKDAAEDKAKEALEEQINQAIADFFGDEGADVSNEEVQEIYNNVYNLIEEHGAEADAITNAILNGGESSDAGLQKILEDRAQELGGMQVARVTEDEYNTEAAKPESERLLFTKVPESNPPTFTPVQPGEYDPEATYYEAYNPDKIDAEHVTDVLIEQLDNFDGMIDRTGEYKLCDPQPTEDQFNAHKGEDGVNAKYYILVSENNYVKAEGDFDSSVQYYKEIVRVNDVDTALALLLEKYLSGEDESSKLVTRSRLESAQPEKTEADVRKVLNDFIKKMIPVEAINKVSDQIGNKAAYALLGLLILFILPWAWFGLLTLVRTLRPRKVWTKAWMVFVFAFPQLILGIVLRYGTTGILAALGSKIPVLQSISEVITPVIRFNCLWASFVYLAMIPFSFIYLIVSHPLKSQWKFERQMYLHEKHRAQMEARRRR